MNQQSLPGRAASIVQMGPKGPAHQRQDTDSGSVEKRLCGGGWTDLQPTPVTADP